MKINMPVTAVEQPYPKGKTLVSKTDLKGTITYANDAFIELSGYGKDELYGKNHNIIRHPDMPPEAFEDLWKTVKEGRPWHGIVKNRCKNGDCYWVDAFVVPIRENNQIVGYMSVRKEPDQRQVEACATLYKAMREGRVRPQARSALDFVHRISFDARYAGFIAGMVALQVVAAVAGILGQPWIAIAAAVAGAMVGGVSVVYMARTLSRPLYRATGYFDRIAQGDLNNDIPISGRSGAEQVLTALAATQVQLRVIIDEITLASHRIQQDCTRLEQDVARVTAQSQMQQDRVMDVSAAMQEVSVSVSEVAHGAEGAAEAAKTALHMVNQGNAEMARSMESTSRVAQAVQTSATFIDELNQSIQRIGSITLVIKEIADQTNLLALNAAIEAARAGEQGRGFAVVADEVRQLAERTTTSTADIAKMVAEIQNAATHTVSAMENAAREVGEGRAQLQTSGDSFQQIAASSRQVTEMAGHIAAAAAEQSMATEGVAGNMERMSALIEENNASISHVDQAVKNLADTADELLKLVRHFDTPV